MKATRSLLVTGLLVGAVVGVGGTLSTRREAADQAQLPEQAMQAQRSQGAANVEAPPQVALPKTERPAQLPVSLPEGAAPVVSGLPDFSALAEALAPSVVNISTESDETDDAERRMSENPFESFQGPRRSLGSGFVFDAEGYIITNAHVVEDATKIVVRLHDEREVEAKVVGSDAKTDIAVIKLEGAENLVPVSLGDSDSLKVGEWVFAIGNPFGLDHTLTAGIVSAKGRRISRRNPYDDFIQTDAAINPGNSGGPLVNLAGQVIGINSAIFSQGGGNIGIGFAIPINMARDIVPQLQKTGHVTRGWLGVKIQPVDADIAKSLGLDEPVGALVAEVFADSPASAAGVQVGDVIVAFDGTDVEKSADLPALVAGTPVGKSAELVVLRAGSKVSLTVDVAKLADDAESARPVRAASLGLTVQDVTPDIAEQLGLEKDEGGVVVTSVTNGSAAANAGLMPGDLVVSVGNQPVENAESFRAALDRATEDKGVLVLVRRGNQTLFRVLKPTAKKGSAAPGESE